MTEQTYNLEHLNVLVVDDNKHMLNIVESILHAMRVRRVRCVGDAALAFTEMRNSPPDIIIVDWAMEPLDGLDFVRLVRNGKDSPDPFTPIILLTGHTEMHRVVEARDAGVHEILAKPISIEGLYRRIVSIIETPREFVRTTTYFGPDRRRKQRSFPGPGRRAEDRDGQGADSPGLSEDEVDNLLGYR